MKRYFMRMEAKRVRLAHWLDQAGFLRAVLWVRSHLPPSWLTVLNFHRIGDPTGHPDFDQQLFDTTPEEFDRQVAMVKRYFRVINTETLLGAVHGKELPSNPAMITFDDGYRDNYDAALPVLERHGVPAAFFVTTSHIAERRIFWWDKIAYLVKQSCESRVELQYPSRLRMELARDRKAAVYALTQVVIREYGLDLERYLQEIARATNVEWNDALERKYADQMIMTWDHVRAMRKAGMDIESHTRTHRVLQTLKPEQLDSELAGSRADIEREIGKAPCAISYPVSRPIVAEPALCDAVRRAGYQLGFSGSTGVTPLQFSFDPLDLRRVGLDIGMPESFFRGILAIPPLAYNPMRRLGQNSVA